MELSSCWAVGEPEFGEMEGGAGTGSGGEGNCFLPSGLASALLAELWQSISSLPPSRANRPLPFFAYPCHCIHSFGSHDGPCALYVGAEFSVVRGHGAYRQLPGRRSKMAVTENAVGVSPSGEALALTPESSTPVRGQFE